jgi:hypothetical protein
MAIRKKAFDSTTRDDFEETQKVIQMLSGRLLDPANSNNQLIKDKIIGLRQELRRIKKAYYESSSRELLGSADKLLAKLKAYDISRIKKY